jgi:FlaA1/EpsC-like NDP-sugar epimerase
MNFFRKLVNWYFRRNSLPYWSIFILDVLILFVSGAISFWIFSNWTEMTTRMPMLLASLFVYVALSVIGIRYFHTYAGIVRYSSFIDLMRVAYANILSLALALGVHVFMFSAPSQYFEPLSGRQIVLMFVIATLIMWGMRVLVKTVYDVSTADNRALRVLVYGAQSGGVGLAESIRTQTPRRFILKGFISHNRRLRHNELVGEKVFTMEDDLRKVVEDYHIGAVLVSPYRTNDFRKNQDLQDLLIGMGVKIFMAQNAIEVEKLGEEDEKSEMVDIQLKEVSVEDLLPRAEIKVDMKSVGELLSGRRVLITGSAGSIGSEMVRQIATCKPASMMLIDQAETPQHDLRLMMAKEFPNIDVHVVVTTVCSHSRMDAIFNQFRPEYVFHAAAYKHVPMMEDNPSEAIMNNVYGTKVIADLSVKYGVRKFVMVSTDKAVNPTNVMGCSKRICEIYVQTLDRAIKTTQYGGHSSLFTSSLPASSLPVTQFVTTRFGNVLGSNGSVIPLFREQIRNGGPVTVTHPDIIRYFMLIPEACKLVLEAGTKGNGGEIFVFDMGRPVKIADLAKRMISLSGAKNVKIEYTGLREGEKLFEEVLNDKETTKPTFHKKIRIAEVRPYDYDQVCKDIDDLIAVSKRYDDMETVRKMKQIVPEYKSNNSVYEELDLPAKTVASKHVAEMS